ncbi:MAG: UDP-3-O-(3-hydroxymyristoyl)glucosamine N-acyltransferase [Sedimentisphaerales bacterium]|nr:UDP-3-O-(3-hydroxymyristoyl)glucosamine N-acyltransferase [Sedimentisphaerales bacterium]
MELTISQLAERIGAELIDEVGAGDLVIRAARPIEAAGANDVTFLTNDKHKASLGSSGAGAVIVGGRLDGCERPQLVVENVDSALIEALNLFAPELTPVVAGIDSSAQVADGVSIGEGVSIGPGVVVAKGVEVGEKSIIGSGCKIGENSTIGANCRLDSNVVIYHNCRLGNHVIVQANSTIGSTGFGYSFIEGSHRLIPHNGGVVIEDFVDIGANCCIDRAKFGDTVVGAGTKIDNLVQVGHNVVIGKCCLIASLVGVSGSCKLGDGVVLGGQVGLADNIELGSGVMVAAKSGVINDIEAGQKVAWTPAIERREAYRIINSVMRLPELAKELKKLGKRMNDLEAAEDGKN